MSNINKDWLKCDNLGGLAQVESNPEQYEWGVIGLATCIKL